MDEDFAALIKALPIQEPRLQPTQDQIDAYTGKLPNLLLNYWRDYGWGAFGDGLFWLVNPAEFAGALKVWCQGVINIDDAFVVGRGAFGKMIVWKKGHGKFMHILPLEHQIFTFKENKHVLAGKDDLPFGIMISQIDSESVDFEDEREKPLFRRALKKLGALGPDEMYAFEPALSLGGSAQLSTLAKVKIEEHLNFLAQLREPEVLHLDTTRFLR